MGVLIINGGFPKGGRTETLTRYISNEYRFDYIHINEANLPMLNGEEKQWQLPSVTSFIKKVQSSVGIILISPEYHGGMSGALKNTLDFLSREQLAHKPVALIATAGGGKGGINCLNNMRTVMRGFYANVIPKQLVIDPDCFHSETKQLLPEAKNLVHELIQEFEMYIKFLPTIDHTKKTKYS
ncbi:NADPH-dependent FMN reductase [Lederbergia graminis]|uniref:NADPH-dependent FMN reductase n=1 Tax=Lederbergia graminis TaxID=735518 RepID=A0ABW0LFV0_9BACI